MGASPRSSGGLSPGGASLRHKPGGISSIITYVVFSRLQQTKLLSFCSPNKNTNKTVFFVLNELTAKFATIPTNDYYSSGGTTYRSTHRDICSEPHKIRRYQPLSRSRYVGEADTAKGSKRGQGVYISDRSQDHARNRTTKPKIQCLALIMIKKLRSETSQSAT